MDQFDRQLEWVTSLTGEDQIAAGSIMAWQGISAALNELVGRFNEVHLDTQSSNDQRHREIHIKKLIVGMFFEMDACMDCWAGRLHASGKLTDEITSKKRAFKLAIKCVGLDVLKEIRNGVAFHCSDYLGNPGALVQTYKKLDSITLDQLNELLKTGIQCGYAMRDQVVP